MKKEPVTCGEICNYWLVVQEKLLGRPTKYDQNDDEIGAKRQTNK